MSKLEDRVLVCSNGQVFVSSDLMGAAFKVFKNAIDANPKDSSSLTLPVEESVEVWQALLGALVVPKWMQSEDPSTPFEASLLLDFYKVLDKYDAVPRLWRAFDDLALEQLTLLMPKIRKGIIHKVPMGDNGAHDVFFDVFCKCCRRRPRLQHAVGIFLASVLQVLDVSDRILLVRKMDDGGSLILMATLVNFQAM